MRTGYSIRLRIVFTYDKLIKEEFPGKIEWYKSENLEKTE